MRVLIFIILSLLLSCSDRKEGLELITAKLEKNDKTLYAPKPGDWIYSHKETGQTFDQYKKISNPNTADSLYQTIYLQPIGTFDSLENYAITLTAEYLNIFYGLETKILEPLDNKIIPDTARRIGMDGHEQFLAPYILNTVLKSKLPKDAVGIMAITEKDIYPKPEWDFVFGLGSYREKVGVTSIFRFSQDIKEGEVQNTFINRLLKITSHELGHMFSLKHCTNAVCIMNGTNGLFETDVKPNRLCSDCHAKIIWNLKLDPIVRINKLSQFFRKHNFNSDLKLIEADLKLLK
jgi:archaemetzincin